MEIQKDEDDEKQFVNDDSSTKRGYIYAGRVNFYLI